MQDIHGLDSMRWQSYHRKLLALAKTGETLTASQQVACEFLRQAIEDSQQRINLWGSSGVGKTFLAHYFHYSAEGVYFSFPENRKGPEFTPNSVVIFDNAPSDRSVARLVFGDTLWAGASSVILVTREPIDDVVRRIELDLTGRDISQIEDVIRKLFAHLPLDNLGDLERHRSKSGIWGKLRVLVEHPI